MNKPWSHENCTCGYEDRLANSTIVDSRKIFKKREGLMTIRRRRKCANCKGRFTSYEYDKEDFR